MTSEILIRRYDKAFDLYDSNGNGYVEEADLKRLQGQFLAIFGESPTSARAAELAALWGDYWQGLLTMMDHAAMAGSAVKSGGRGMPGSPMTMPATTDCSPRL